MTTGRINQVATFQPTEPQPPLPTPSSTGWGARTEKPVANQGTETLPVNNVTRASPHLLRVWNLHNERNRVAKHAVHTSF